MIQSRSLLVQNLLNDAEEIGAMLLKEVRLSAWLNAYLLASGLNQIVEDQLHPDPLNAGKIAKNLPRLKFPGSLILASAAQKTGDILLDLEYKYPGSVRLLRCQQELAEIVQYLADIVTGQAAPSRPMLARDISSVLKEMRSASPQVLGKVLRLPSCFRSFDQQPEDLECLVQDFAARWPDRFQPLVVVGIRTSGSYLAPLCVSYLKALGFRDAVFITYRPGRKFQSHERKILESVTRRGGRVLVTDDPPATGASLLKATAELEKTGIPSQSITLLLQLFGSEKTLSSALQRYDTILLPWEAWSVQARLEPLSMHMMLDDIFSNEYYVNSVERLPLAERKWARSHIRALYQVNLTDIETGREVTRKLFVEGAGLGYFGEHSLAVKSAMGDFLPEVYGFRDGLLVRAWLPEQNRVAGLKGVLEADYVTNLVTYVQKRHHVLAVPADVSREMIGENSSWEVASNLLSKVFGRAWVMARVLFLDRLARRLLEVKNPSVIDGKMDIDNWFVDDTGDRALKKIGFSERDFSNLDLFSFDPVSDLAGLAASRPIKDFSERIRQTYQELSGEKINPERWLLYQWIHLWDKQRLYKTDPAESSKAISRLFQNYYSEVFFKDLALSPDGPVCALDVDGVLETDTLGFNILTPASALALRALVLHGYRPVLATGRSLDYVRDCCQAYPLAGGAVEYGAVIYSHVTGKVELLLSEEDCRSLDRLRAELSAIESIFIDQSYHYAVRAYQKDANGNRRNLSPDDVSLAIEKSGLDSAVRIIPGEHQTDFMLASIDKGIGLRCLLEELDKDACAESRPLAFAVGDTVSDAPMFALAQRSFVPGHAAMSLDQPRIKRMAGPYQSGLSQAVEVVLGHKPGACQQCKPAPFSPERGLFLDLLSAQEGGTWSMVKNALKLSASVRRQQHANI